MNRYSRLLNLSDFSEEKLSLLQSTKILVVGVGGVGQNVAVQLVTNGVENLTIIDFDKVEISNLNRQFLLTEKDIGKDKVEVVKSALESKNSDAHINAINDKVNETNASKLLKGFDVVIDATDNWEAKLLIAKTCKQLKTPLLHIGVDGYVGQFCIFKEISLSDIVSEEIKAEKKDGVSGSMVATISSFAALHLIDYLTKENMTTDVMYFYDHKANNFSKIKL